MAQEKKQKMEREVEQELSNLIELTIQLEDELNNLTIEN